MGDKEELFNTNKQYQWNPQDKFELDGTAFSILLNTCRAILGSEEGMKIMAVKQASDKLEDILRQAVNTGAVKELEQPLTLNKEVPIN